MYSNIVVGTDGSTTAGRALARAIELAKAFNATLHIVSAYRAPIVRAVNAERGGSSEEVSWQVGASDEVDGILATAQAKAAEAGVEAKTHGVSADPVDAILGCSEAVGAEVIVIGSKGMERRLMGSIPNTVAHQAEVDILIVHTA
ncbi:MAG TPA: universal stress protein [Actinomycetota bacterium]|nr:universal stress protein [Actinomycetota bacterium]